MQGYHGMRNLTSFVFLVIFLFTLTEAHSEPLEISPTPLRIFDPNRPDAKKFGRLVFRGGLVLSSSHADFGGISAMRFTDNDGSFVALTDKARVITGVLVREGGRPAKIVNAAITRIKAANGRTITGARDKDSEALEIMGGRFIVGYERNDRLVTFNMKKRKLIAVGKSAAIDLNTFEFADNRGPEAIALNPKTGELFVFAEHSLDDAGNHRGFVFRDNKLERKNSVRASDGYSLTDAQFQADGSLILLERYFNPFTGVFMRLRLINPDDVSSDKPLDGPVLIEAGPRYEIDNMEALALSTSESGAVRLTLVSDDNFSDRQRTILLEFEISENR